MNFNWAWQGILSNWLYDLIVPACGGLMILARARQWRYSSPVLYGLATAALMAAILYTVGAHHILVEDQASKTNPQNVQERVRLWIDNFGLTNQSIPDPQAYFRYMVTLANGNQLVIGRYRAKEQYLVIDSAIRATEPEKEFLKKLPKNRVDRLQAEMIEEAARAKIGFQNLTVPYENANLEKRVPITSDLTEASFMASIDELDSAVIALKATYTLAMSDVKR